jgi:hypothetical protein
MLIICIFTQAEELILCSFETESEFTNWQITERTITFNRTVDFSTDGLFGAKFQMPTFVRDSQQPGILFKVNEIKGLLKDWSEFNVLLLDYKNFNTTFQEINIRITDLYGNNLLAKQQLAAREGTICIPLENIERKLIKELYLYFSEPSRINLAFDALRLKHDKGISLKPLDSAINEKKIQIGSFETKYDLYQWNLRGNVSTAITDSYSTDGNYSLSINFKKYETGSEEYPGIILTKENGLQSDWSELGLLTFDYFNPLPVDIPLSFRVYHSEGSLPVKTTLAPGRGTGKVVVEGISSKEVARLFIYIVGPKQEYNFYIDNLRVIPKPKGEPLQIVGNVVNHVYYAPEVGFEFINRISSKSVLEYGSDNNYAQLELALSFPRYFGSNQKIPNDWGNDNGRFNFMAVRVRGSLYPNTQPINFMLGKWPIYYSSYIAQFNTDYTISASGIVFDGLKWYKTSLSGFLLWEASRPYGALGEGFRIRYQENPFKGELLLVRHLKNTSIVEQEGEIKKIGCYIGAETDLSFQIEKTFEQGGKLSYLDIRQIVHDAVEKQYTVKKTDLQLPVGNYNIGLSYRNFAPNFAPRYRDKTPKYYSWPGGNLMTNWAPTEKYKGQRGITFQIKRPYLKYNTVFEADYYVLQNDFSKHTTLSLDINGEVNRCQFLLVSKEPEKLFSFVAVSAKRELLITTDYLLSGIIGYSYDRTGIYNNLKYNGAVLNLGIDNKYVDGFFEGLKLSAGIQLANRKYYYLRGSWALMSDVLSVEFAIRKPNIIEAENSWVDELGRVLNRDNYLQISTRLDF